MSNQSSTITTFNPATSTTWTRPVIRLDPLKRHVLLSTKQRIFGILQFLAVKNGCRLLNLSAWTESRFLRSSFLRGKLSLENGSLKPMLRLTGSFQSTVEVGQAMHT